eukprot:gene19182-61671_t
MGLAVLRRDNAGCGTCRFSNGGTVLPTFLLCYVGLAVLRRDNAGCGTCRFSN